MVAQPMQAPPAAAQRETLQQLQRRLDASWEKRQVVLHRIAEITAGFGTNANLSADKLKRRLEQLGEAPSSVRQAVALAEELPRARQTLKDIAAAIASLRTAIDERQQDAAAARALTPRGMMIERKRDEYIETITRVEQAAAALADALRAALAAGQQLGQAIGSAYARRAFDLAPFRERAHRGLVDLFEVDPAAPGERPHRPMLALPAGIFGARAGFVEIERNLCNGFTEEKS